MDQMLHRDIEQYKKNLEKLGIHPARVMLFGSHASGKANENSDVDLLVISKDFKSMDLWERLRILGRATVGIDSPMEILGYTEEEYSESGPGSFVGDEIKPHAIEVS